MTAIGVFETRGMVPLVAAADAMAKVADVRIRGRHSIGAGWITTMIEGDVAAVQTALQVGEREAVVHGELIMSEMIARPETAPLAAMPHMASGATAPADYVAGHAIGMLETQGLAALVAGADAMVKAARVSITGWTFIGGGLSHIAVIGDVAAVRTAVESGASAAGAAGSVVANLVLPQPSKETIQLIPSGKSGSRSSVGALGVLETTGYVGVVAAADAMTKAGAVEIRRFALASGGRISTFVTGHLEDVRVALSAGAAAAEKVGELNGTQVVSHPDEATVACFCDARVQAGAGGDEALGMIETRSTVALVKAVDEMLKASPVRFEGTFKVGYFLTASAVRGNVGAVQSALDVGATTAAQYGDLVSVDLIPFPFANLDVRLPHQ